MSGQKMIWRIDDYGEMGRWNSNCFWELELHTDCSSLKKWRWDRLVLQSEYITKKIVLQMTTSRFILRVRQLIHQHLPSFLGLNLKLQTSTCRLQAKLRMQPTCYYLCPNSSYIHQLSLEAVLSSKLLTFSNHPPMTNHFQDQEHKCTTPS